MYIYIVCIYIYCMYIYILYVCIYIYCMCIYREREYVYNIYIYMLYMKIMKTDSCQKESNAFGVKNGILLGRVWVNKSPSSQVTFHPSCCWFKMVHRINCLFQSNTCIPLENRKPPVKKHFCMLAHVHLHHPLALRPLRCILAVYQTRACCVAMGWGEV